MTDQADHEGRRLRLLLHEKSLGEAIEKLRRLTGNPVLLGSPRRASWRWELEEEISRGRSVLTEAQCVNELSGLRECLKAACAAATVALKNTSIDALITPESAASVAANVQ